MIRIRQQSRPFVAVILLIGSVVAAVGILLLVMPVQSVQARVPQQVPLPTLDPTQFPTDGTPEPPIPSPGPSPTPSPLPPAPNPIQQIIRYFFQIFFPANTFREAVEGAARAIFNAEIEALAQPMREVLNTVMFAGESVSGNVPLPGQFSAVVDLMTKAAVPIWGLSLALMALAVLTRQAVGLGYGSNEVAGEAAHWFFIALASGNGYTLVTLVHNGIGALTRAIASGGGFDAGRIIGALLFDGFAPDISIIILILIAIIGIITIIVLAVTYVARYALMVGLAALAPLAIACEGIPFTRFICRDWLSMFLKVELLQVLNVAVLRIFADLGLSQWGVFVEGTGGYLIKLVVMVGLASAIIGLNTSVFKQVFTTAIEVVQQMKQATEQLVGALVAVAGVAATASTGLPLTAASGLAMSGAGGGGNSSANNNGLNSPSGSLDGSSTSGFGSGDSQNTATGHERASSKGEADSGRISLSGRRASYRVGASADGRTANAQEAEPTNSGEGASQHEADTHNKGATASTEGDRSEQDTAGVEESAISRSQVAEHPIRNHPASHSDRGSTSNHGASSGAEPAQMRDQPIATSSPNTNGSSALASNADSAGVDSQDQINAPSADGASDAAAGGDTSGDKARPIAAHDAPELQATTGRTSPGSTPKLSPQATPQQDARQIASEMGAYARAISLGSRMDGVAGAALRGFGMGASMGDQIHRQRSAMEADSGEGNSANYLQRLQGQQNHATESRADRLAFRLGASSALDRQQIAHSLMPNDSTGLTSSGYTPDEMRQAHIANEPLLRDMVSQYGGPARAAALGGYGSFGAMANAMAVERLQTTGVEPQRPPSPEFASQPPPVSTWTSARPAESDETRMLPHDYGLGALVAGNLGSDPTSAPEWARTMHSLRQAYPAQEQSVFSDFVAGVQSGLFADETAARSWLEGAVQERPPIAHDVQMWWRADERVGRPAAQHKQSNSTRPSDE